MSVCQGRAIRLYGWLVIWWVRLLPPDFEHWSCLIPCGRTFHLRYLALAPGGYTAAQLGLMCHFHIAHQLLRQGFEPWLVDTDEPE